MAIAFSWAVSLAAEADPREMELSVICCLVLVVPDIGFMPLFLKVNPTIQQNVAYEEIPHVYVSCSFTTGSLSIGFQ
jgi:hypothetical protein